MLRSPRLYHRPSRGIEAHPTLAFVQAERGGRRSSCKSFHFLFLFLLAYLGLRMCGILGLFGVWCVLFEYDTRMIGFDCLTVRLLVLTSNTLVFCFVLFICFYLVALVPLFFVRLFLLVFWKRGLMKGLTLLLTPFLRFLFSAAAFLVRYLVRGIYYVLYP